MAWHEDVVECALDLDPAGATTSPDGEMAYSTYNEAWSEGQLGDGSPHGPIASAVGKLSTAVGVAVADE